MGEYYWYGYRDFTIQELVALKASILSIPLLFHFILFVEKIHCLILQIR